jgi:hypothetical protein
MKLRQRFESMPQILPKPKLTTTYLQPQFKGRDLSRATFIPPKFKLKLNLKPGQQSPRKRS